jgi:hypothetical protein
MSIVLTSFNWNTGQEDPFPVNEKAVEKFVQFFLSSKAWHDDIELVHKKVSALRRDAQVEPQAMLTAPPTKPQSKPKFKQLK